MHRAITAVCGAAQQLRGYHRHLTAGFGSWKIFSVQSLHVWLHQLPPTVQTLVSEVDCTPESPVQ